MERSRSLEFIRDNPYLTVFLVGSIAIAGLTTYSVTNSLDYPDETYKSQFTDKNHCLHDTPYDPAKGANLTVNKDILTVVPQAANSYTPSVLQFVFKHDKIHFSDVQTGSFLVKAGCIDANSGQ